MSSCWIAPFIFRKCHPLSVVTSCLKGNFDINITTQGFFRLLFACLSFPFFCFQSVYLYFKHSNIYLSCFIKSSLKIFAFDLGLFSPFALHVITHISNFEFTNPAYPFFLPSYPFFLFTFSFFFYYVIILYYFLYQLFLNSGLLRNNFHIVKFIIFTI